MARLRLLAGLLCCVAPFRAVLSAETAFDGSYKGEAKSTSGGMCRDYNPTLKVEGGNFSMRYSPELILTGAVMAGGTVTSQGSSISSRGQMSTINLAGKIAGGVATLTSDSPRCHYDMKLTKIP